MYKKIILSFAVALATMVNSACIANEAESLTKVSSVTTKVTKEATSSNTTAKEKEDVSKVESIAKDNNSVNNSKEEQVQKDICRLTYIGITNEYVNFRKGSSTQTEKLGAFNPKTEITILSLSKENGFYKCKSNGKIGYVFAQFVDIKEKVLYALTDTVVEVGSKSVEIKEGEKIEFYYTNIGFVDKKTSNILKYNEDDFSSTYDYNLAKLKKSKLKLLTSVSTYYSYEEEFLNKAYNIALCSSTMDWTVIPKNENFNWHINIGNTNKNEGYKLANAFAGGKVVQSYGGGVCQLASTLYDCALNLKFKIIERHPHGLPVDYVDYEGGMDAAVDDIGGYNLIFKNTLNCDVVIRVFNTKVLENDISQRGKLTVEIYEICK